MPWLNVKTRQHSPPPFPPLPLYLPIPPALFLLNQALLSHLTVPYSSQVITGYRIQTPREQHLYLAQSEDAFGLCIAGLMLLAYLLLACLLLACLLLACLLLAGKHAAHMECTSTQCGHTS